MTISQIGIKIGVEGAAQVQRDLNEVKEAASGLNSSVSTVGQALGNYTQMTRDARVEANLLRQANRQLAMQMTDVVTSLASGMPAWMIFIQQGGQIKDSYGGIGKAIQGVTGYLRALVNPVTLAAAAVAGLGAVTFIGSREMDAYAKALVLSGNAAGTTAGALDMMAERIGKIAGTQGKAAEVLAAMATEGDIAASALERAALAAIQLERAGGPAAAATAKQFASLGKEPLQAALKLNESTRFLTLSVYEQIKALESQGRTADASAAAISAYASVVEDRTKALEGRLVYLQKAWRGLGDAAKGAWDFMLGLERARQTSPEEELAGVQRRLAQAMANQANARSDNRARYQTQVEALRLQEGLLQEQIRLQGRGIALENERAAVVQARAEWDKKGSQYLSDQQKMQKEITEAQRLGLEGKIAQAEVDSRIAAIRASYASKGDGLSAEAKATAEAVKAREKYIETLTTSAAKMAQENQSLADQVRLVVMGKEAFQDLVNAREEEQAVLLETQAIRALDRNLDAKEYAALIDQAKAIRERINLRKALATATVESIDREIMARRSAFKDQDAQDIIDTERLKNSQSIIDAIDRETAALRMSNVEREVTIALLAAEARGLKVGSYEYEEYAKKIREAIVNRETVRESIEQTRQIEREWQRTADQIGQSLTDALMQGGKSAWEYIKGLFRSMVLRPVIQAIVNPVAGAVLGGLGMPAAAGPLGALSGVNSLSALASTITSGVTGSLANVIGGAGSLFGSSALTSFAAGMRGATLAPGLAGPTTAGAGGALGAGASVAAAVPYVAAALAVANAVGLFRSRTIVGGGLTGTLGAGDITSYELQRRGGTLFSGPSYSMVNQQVSAQTQAIQSAYEALRANAAAMADALGVSGDAVRKFTTVLGTDIVQNDIGVRGIKLDNLTPEQAAAKVQEALNTANEQLASFVLGASTNLSRAGESAVQTLTRLSSSITAINPVLRDLGLTLYDTSLAGADMASQLADAFGGLEAFGQATANYYAEFYTEAERASNATRALTETLSGLGLSLPESRDAYRDLVEAQDLSTEAGRKNFATLVSLSGAFAELNPILEGTEEAGRSAADILRERQGLERQLLQLQGDTNALRALDRAALDESNRALFDQIEALQESQAAATAAAESERALAAERDRIAQERSGLERSGLERQLLQLQGDTTAIRALDRAALDESNRALFDRIMALQDEQAATAAAAANERTLAAERERIAQERAGLERQLLQLQGNTAAIRALERDALDDSNRSLYDRITALQDEQAATAANARAAQDFASSTQRLADQAGSATDAAFAAVRRAIEAEAAAAEAALRSAYETQIAGIEAQKTVAAATRDAASETLTAARRIFEYLGQQIDDLRGTVGAGMSGAAGRAFIERAIGAARSTGALPDADQLAQAVAAARGELSSSRYGSAFEMRRDSLVLAGRLSELQALAGNQSTVAERALRVAEDQLDELEDAAKQAKEHFDAQTDLIRSNASAQLNAAQAQIDVLRGIDTRVISVAQAIQELANAMRSESTARAAAVVAQNVAAAAATPNPSATSTATSTAMRSRSQLEP